jgi:hypothetical protein
MYPWRANGRKREREREREREIERERERVREGEARRRHFSAMARKSISREVEENK